MPVPKKSLGQNFLQHPQIAERIVREARVAEGVPVLEIGPGTGMLTRALLAAGHRVIAVEADGELYRALTETFSREIGEGRLEIFHEDIRTFAVEPVLERNRQGNSYAVVANIPYYLTGDIIRRFLTARHKPISMTLLVQKEVAERIARQRGKNPKESLLSLSVKAFGTPRYCFTVTKGSFFPPPKVDSAVISIDSIRQDAFTTAADEAFFFEVLRAGFVHKRKLLIRNLEELFPRERIAEGFEKAGIPASIRPEDLTLEQWQQLVHHLSTHPSP